jgi:pyruvate/2-oxoglutarate dehydrogenase complex dihydrolipoamide dehydrogenase (E3) component
MQQSEEFDVAVVGGGAGGLFAASVAKALGAKPCIIEKNKLGGDCTWYGCMPSKAILKSAQIAHYFKKAGDYGIKVSSGFALDTHGAMPHVRNVVKEISTHHEPEDLEKRGIKVFFGPSCFVNSDQLQLGDSFIKAKRWVICTGSHPMVPAIDGIKEIPYLTNENVFDLEKLPESLIVLGGGPIGCELSQALCRLGVKVTIVEMTERILIREDKELSKYVEGQFKRDGVRLVTGKQAVKLSKENNQVSIVVEDQNKKQEKIIADNVLVAVGRAPNVEGLNLNKANVEFSAKGIKVNEYLQTTNPNIFACGDIASPYQFSHVAAYQAGVCIRNALFKRIAWQKVNYSNMTWATFTDPELAHLGLTESEAREKSSKIKVYTTPYTNSDRATTDGEKEGLLKVVTNEKGLILGAHVVGANAGEIIQGFLIAKSQKIPLSKLAQTMFIYPTLSELVKKTAAKSLIEKGNQPLVKWFLKILKNI